MSVFSAIDGFRQLSPIKAASKVKCGCCGNRSTHNLIADGAVMGAGCELFGKRWVKDARSAFASLHRLKKVRSAE